MIDRHIQRSIGILTVIVLTAAMTTARPAASGEVPTLVTISRTDVDALGGWPIDRRWYAVAIDNLARAGAERILIDIAFPQPDGAHPESDQLFVRALERHDNVFLLSDRLEPGADSVLVAGRTRLPAQRFFAPFSASFTVRGRHLVLRQQPDGALIHVITPSLETGRPVLIRLPAERPAAGVPFLDVVQGNLSAIDGDVVIALDYPGVTSYLAHPRMSAPLSTATLQLHAAEAIQKGAYRTQWSSGLLLILLLSLLAPLAGAGRHLERRYWLWISAGLCLIVPGALAAAGIYIPAASYALVLLPVSLLGWIRVRTTLPADAPPVVTPLPQDRRELDDLRWRVRFYEHLEAREPDSDAGEEDDMRFAPGSPLLTVLRKAQKVAQTDLPVLIMGESGVGKELMARYLHRHSTRQDAAFVAVNCAAVPAELIESELFGHEKGAFTGAQARRVGLFERADGGTLFLDEVSETSAAFQAKLLRVLQDGTFSRVGGSERLHASVRVLAATHRDLSESIRQGRFRQDLFYRLNGIALQIPPLRERPDDVIHLFQEFLSESDRAMRTSDALHEWLRAQPWPGNVRELKAATQRAVVNAELRRRSFLLPQDFELGTRPDVRAGADSTADQVLEELRRQAFSARSISRSADALSLHRSTVTEYLRGWIIRLLNGHAPDDIPNALRGSADVDVEQLRKRARRYVSGIFGRIDDGVRGGESDDEIRLGRFRNLPQEFQDDLRQLIHKRRRPSG